MKNPSYCLKITKIVTAHRKANSHLNYSQSSEEIQSSQEEVEQIHPWNRIHDKVLSPKGGGGTPYNELYGEAPPERGAFFSLEVYKRVGISRVEV